MRRFSVVVDVEMPAGAGIRPNLPASWQPLTSHGMWGDGRYAQEFAKLRARAATAYNPPMIGYPILTKLNDEQKFLSTGRHRADRLITPRRLFLPAFSSRLFAAPISARHGSTSCCPAATTWTAL